MPFWSRSKESQVNYVPAYPQNCYANSNPVGQQQAYPPYHGNAYANAASSAPPPPAPPDGPPAGNAYDNSSRRDTFENVPVNADGNEDNRPLNLKYRIHEQDEEKPMDLGELQDIFTFEFIRGRPIWNFILAILWSIGLPILLYHLLKPHLGQIVAMVVAACPPLLIVVLRMLKTRTFDILGLIAGVSFLLSGIVSIAEPEGVTAAILESLVPLIVGVICLVSLIPIRIGSYKMRPVIYELANQIMPRAETDEDLQKQDEHRLSRDRRMTKAEKLDWTYRNMARFRMDLRIMTAAWGLMLIIGFFVKLAIALTDASTGSAELAGFLIFGLGSFFMACFTWIYTKIVALKHVREDAQGMNPNAEAMQNANWGVQTMSNAWGQVMG